MDFFVLFVLLQYRTSDFDLLQIESFIKLRKMLSRKILLDVRLWNCSTPRVLRFTYLTSYLDGRSVLDSSYITENKFITFVAYHALGALRASTGERETPWSGIYS